MVAGDGTGIRDYSICNSFFIFKRSLSEPKPTDNFSRRDQSIILVDRSKIPRTSSRSFSDRKPGRSFTTIRLSGEDIQKVLPEPNKSTSQIIN